jgi:hypothetical protein
VTLLKPAGREDSKVYLALAKLGMREEGVFRDNLLVRGEWWSTVQSAVLSTDEVRPSTAA